MKSKFKSEYFQVLRPNHITHQGRVLRKYCLFPNDNAVTSTLINGWVYEPYMFDFLKDNQIKLEGTDVVEIGANNGHFTVEFAELVGDLGRVFSFEPQRIIYQQLCGNVFMNGLDNVSAYQVAVGDSNGKIEFEYPNYHFQGDVNFGDISVKNNRSKSNIAFEEVETRTLDSYSFKEVKLIKIDVQGYEPFVLDGAKLTIEKHRPYIFIEIEDESLKRFDFNENQLIEKIEKLGYVVKRFQVGIPYNTASGICLDCICIPKEKYESKNYQIK
jgi:FkbM family methyltransferase